MLWHLVLFAESNKGVNDAYSVQSSAPTFWTSQQQAAFIQTAGKSLLLVVGVSATQPTLPRVL